MLHNMLHRATTPGREYIEEDCRLCPLQHTGNHAGNVALEKPVKSLRTIPTTVDNFHGNMNM